MENHGVQCGAGPWIIWMSANGFRDVPFGSS